MWFCVQTISLFSTLCIPRSYRWVTSPQLYSAHSVLSPAAGEQVYSIAVTSITICATLILGIHCHTPGTTLTGSRLQEQAHESRGFLEFRVRVGVWPWRFRDSFVDTSRCIEPSIFASQEVFLHNGNWLTAHSGSRLVSRCMHTGILIVHN